MQKVSTEKAFFLLTLLFVLIAVASFAAFRETEQACAQVQSCFKTTPAAQNGEMLWELVSRQILSLLSI